MVLSDQQLLQIDADFLTRLRMRDPAALARLSLNLANDLKEARERLNQNPTNSSRPSGSMPPWDKVATDDTSDPHRKPGDRPDIDPVNESRAKTQSDSAPVTGVAGSDCQDNAPAPRKPGRQPRAPGAGRTQKLPVTHWEHHRCSPCSLCHRELQSVEKAYTGFYCVNVEFGAEASPGLRLTNTHHLYYAASCPHCGLDNRSQPWRAPPDRGNWEEVGLTEWRLIGPDLAAMIVYLSMEMRITRRRVQLFLSDLLGLKLSLGCLQNGLIESARALAPVEDQLVNDLLSESLLHADETSHNEAGTALWLWVFITSSTALYQVGRRSKEIFIHLLDSATVSFDGWLMSDGYLVYRGYQKRLRCWAHLTRKAKGLAESYSTTSRNQGNQVLNALDRLMAAIYRAREGPDQGQVTIAAHYQAELEDLRALCEVMAASSHEKTRALGREFLNDWEAIFRVLDHPAWPLTNNEAERALRHWVIMRKITQGTRSEQGSRALALFASVITTCRLRDSSPLLFIRDVIQLRRQGKAAPVLPPIPVTELAA
jgi:IS1 family transposase